MTTENVDMETKPDKKHDIPSATGRAGMANRADPRMAVRDTEENIVSVFVTRGLVVMSMRMCWMLYTEQRWMRFMTLLIRSSPFLPLDVGG